MRKVILLPVVALVVMLAGACRRGGDLIDNVKPGTPVTVTTANGQSVSGELKEARPDAVVIQPPNGPAAVIPRAQISTLTISTKPGAAGGQALASGQQPSAPAPSPGVPVEPGSGSEARAAGQAQGGSGAPPGTAMAGGSARDASAHGAGTGAVAAAPRAPAFREVTIPAGTRLSIQLEEGVSSDRSRPEEPVRATLVDDLDVAGVVVVPAGSLVGGNVTSVKRSGKVKGVAQLAIRFDSITPKGSEDRYQVRTGLVERRARTTRRKDALEIGGPAAGGLILGGLLGGKKGAVIGGTIGGGAGTAVVLSTRGQEVRLPTGTRLAIKLLDAVTVRVPA